MPTTSNTPSSGGGHQKPGGTTKTTKGSKGGKGKGKAVASGSQPHTSNRSGVHALQFTILARKKAK